MACRDDIWFVVYFLVLSLVIGIVGFRLFCGCNWYQSLCSSCMALGGCYTVDKNEPGLLFCSFFILYGKIIFFVVIMLVITRICQQLREDDDNDRHHK
jgi:hypothetical protein